MSTGTTIAIVAGGVLVVGIIFVVANRPQPQPTFVQGGQSSPGLQGDAALLYAGLAGGGSLLSGLMTGIANLSRSSGKDGGSNKNPYTGFDPSRPVDQGGSLGTGWQPRGDT